MQVLYKYADQIESMRLDMLFSEESDMDNPDPESEQYFLLAIATLESAHRLMKLAAIKGKTS